MEGKITRYTNEELQERLSESLLSIAKAKQTIADYEAELRRRYGENRNAKLWGFYKGYFKIASLYEEDLQICENVTTKLLLGLNKESNIRKAYRKNGDISIICS